MDSIVTSYTYDSIDELLSETRTGYACSYAYDANGNRTSKTLNGVTDVYSVDDGDKLLSVSRGGVTIKSLAYDAQGRTTGITTASGTTTMSYDYEGRLTGIGYPSSATNSFGYNAFDTRISKADSAGTFTFLRDGVGVTDPVLTDGAATYTPGVSERRGSTSKFTHQDRLGSTTLMTDAAQTVTDTRATDAFGNPTSATGSTPTPFTFAGAWGYQQDSDSGLMLLGHRYYDASTGRFLTRDPAKDGRNWYGYCANNPVKWIDSTGLWDEKVLRIIREAIQNGEIRPGTAGEYQNDPSFARKVHENMRRRKIPGERKNPDLGSDEIKEAVQDALEYRSQAGDSTGASGGWDWGTIGAGAGLLAAGVGLGLLWVAAPEIAAPVTTILLSGA